MTPQWLKWSIASFLKNINNVRMIHFKNIIEIQVNSTHLMKILMDQGITTIQDHPWFLS
jgi:hypothetical protein